MGYLLLVLEMQMVGMAALILAVAVVVVLNTIPHIAN
jgi:hypothetical protein